MPVCYSGAIFFSELGAIMAWGIEARLAELGIDLPALRSPGGNYVPAKTVGQMVYLSGVISTGTDGVITGTVGAGGRLRKVMPPPALAR
jgi:hypothetical protein